MAAIELIVLSARMKNTELKMAGAPPPFGLPWSLDRRVTEVEMMEFERVSGGEEEAEDAISAISALAEANFKSVGRQPQDNRTKLRPQHPTSCCY